MIKTEEKAKQRKNDFKQLIKAKELEKEQLKSGYKWLLMGKSRRLVHPCNIETMLSIGWKTTNNRAA